jgi:hypothetical protein
LILCREGAKYKSLDVLKPAVSAAASQGRFLPSTPVASNTMTTSTTRITSSTNTIFHISKFLPDVSRQALFIGTLVFFKIINSHIRTMAVKIDIYHQQTS